MLKLIDILEEGTLQLTSDERRQVEEMIPEIIKTMSANIGDNMYRTVGQIDAISADKTPIKVEVRLGNDLNVRNADGYFQTDDPKNPTDNYIFIQQFHFSKYFTGAGGLDMKATKILTGDENIGVEKLRQVLKHELIHAKDPKINQYRHKNHKGSSGDLQVYYKSWSEFQTMTGQFFEAITTGVDRALKQGKNKNQILGALDNILEYYSGKTKNFNTYAKDFIQGTGNRNIFQALIKLASDIIAPTGSSISEYAAYLAAIKQYNPEGYKEFLKDLYKTIDQAKDKLNNLQEMKYINEAKRFQQLAGIIKEEEEQTDPVADKDAEQGLKQALAGLKASIPSLKPSPKDGELDESLLITGVLAAPGILQVLGKGVNLVSSMFQKDKKKGTAVGNALAHWGHKLEDSYLIVIGQILKTLFPTAYGNQDVQDERSVLHDHARLIYLLMLTISGMNSGLEAVDAAHWIEKTLHGADALIGSVDVAKLAAQIAKA